MQTLQLSRNATRVFLTGICALLAVFMVLMTTAEKHESFDEAVQGSVTVKEMSVEGTTPEPMQRIGPVACPPLTKGVFAQENHAAGDIIEVCPLVLESRERDLGALEARAFPVDSVQKGVAFGTCSMYNHAQNPNIALTVDKTGETMTIYALRDINVGEELFISYGDEWWAARGVGPGQCVQITGNDALTHYPKQV
jgi:uncharacterized protein